MQPSEGEGTVLRLDLTPGNDADQLEELARVAFQAGLGLVEFTPTRASLEEIFAELTVGKGAAAPFASETAAAVTSEEVDGE